MATVQNPLIGRASGKFATAIFSKNFKRNIIRSKGVTHVDAESPAQIVQRQKHTSSLKFVLALLPIIQIGFKHVSDKCSAYASAMSYVIKNCLKFESDSWIIDMSKIVLSLGSLPLPLNVVVNSAVWDDLDISWNDTYLPYGLTLDDDVHIVLIDATDPAAIKYFEDNTKVDGGYNSPLIESMEGNNYHIYLFISNAKNTAVSNTLYLGMYEL